MVDEAPNPLAGFAREVVRTHAQSLPHPAGVGWGENAQEEKIVLVPNEEP